MWQSLIEKSVKWIISKSMYDVMSYTYYLLQAGLATLFSAIKLYDTDFHSLGLHFTPLCKVNKFTNTWFN